MSLAERPSRRNGTRRAGLSRVAEDLSAMRVTTPTPPSSTAGPSSTSIIIGGRRRKSRSPGSTWSRTDGATITTVVSKKRKSTASSSSGATSSMYFTDDIAGDRGRKTKLKTQSRHSVENTISAVEQQSQQYIRRLSKKERSKSRDSRERTRKHPLSEASAIGEKSGPNATTTSSSATCELSRVKKELEAIKKELDPLKKQAYENRKTVNSQNRVIDELRQKLSNGEKIIKDTEHQIQKLKSKSKRSDETIANIEGNLNCQICMELLLKPFALSPCGHVLCQSCLQGWFRKAPPNDEDMYDDDDPDYLIYRLKSCPCCRANVRDRPVPVFIVKSIAVALTKSKEAKAGSSAARASPLPTEGDPWAGLFPPAGEDEFGEDDDEDGNEEDEEDEDEDEEEDDEDEDDYSEWLTEVFAYGSASEEEPFEGDYVSPQWEPPTIDIDPTDFEFEDLDDDDLNVLRRGATIDMLDSYQMTYSHEEGLVARVDIEQLYLGWNIRLSADDDTGEEFIDYLFKDMLDRPERWVITEGDDGGRVCHRLVPEDEVLNYETTDSEVDIDYGECT